ncbi:hypothetical protein [Flavobacterium caseinilyticum]|uniref:Uncharacterized protein n=1 Tax=Flavobacterium caseinilyticum TaxID=2541732 RepID=A0A4V2YTP9_9FLAO|nr:hypothetical protein [Flavobacterium caseinilyticum]TDD74637.1 hypothetical protein E0F89_14115 [Flavobacterium caseinilyticum]
MDEVGTKEVNLFDSLFCFLGNFDKETRQLDHVYNINQPPEGEKLSFTETELRGIKPDGIKLYNICLFKLQDNRLNQVNNFNANSQNQSSWGKLDAQKVRM